MRKVKEFFASMDSRLRGNDGSTMRPNRGVQRGRKRSAQLTLFAQKQLLHHLRRVLAHRGIASMQLRIRAVQHFLR